MNENKQKMKTRSESFLEREKKRAEEEAMEEDETNETDEDDKWDSGHIVVLADGVGGFKFSRAGIEWLANKGHMDAQLIKMTGYEQYNMGDKYLDEFEIDIARHDPLLLELISVMGEDQASGTYTRFRLMSIPDTSYTIINEGSYEKVYYPSCPFEKRIP